MSVETVWDGEGRYACSLQYAVNTGDTRFQGVYGVFLG